MTSIRSTAILSACTTGLLLLASTVPAHADNAAHGHTHVAQTSAPAQATAARAATMADGEVRKVDKSTKKITLKHGEIRNLDMPPMTMVFRVSDPAMLDQVKPGDKVRFAAEEIKGNVTVTAIEVAK